MDCHPPSYSVHGDSPGNNIGLSCHALLQGISRDWTQVSHIAGGFFTTFFGSLLCVFICLFYYLSAFLSHKCNNCKPSGTWCQVPTFFHHLVPMLCLVTQSCPTLCGPMDCSLPSYSVHGDSPGKNTGVGCHFLLQGIFPTQGSNQGLLHCRQILYQLRYQGSLFWT